MEVLVLLEWLHVIGACVLLGTGAGIAFFMLMAHRTGNPAFIAHTAHIVVIADVLFTATAAIVQPLTGIALMWQVGWEFTEGWIVLALLIYVLIGAFWLPVVFIQIRLRDLARQADSAGTGLPGRYHALFRIWVLCGIPAFAAMLVMIWLMLARPAIEWFA